MWYCPPKYEKQIPDLNKELFKLEGELSDKEAKLTLAQFLRANLGLAVEIIAGLKLAPYQEVALKGFFNRSYSMCVWGRGCAKSFIAAVYCFLVCIFEPGTKVLIAGPTFRTARNIFTELEKIVKSPGAELLAQAFFVNPPSHKNDLLSWEFPNGSSIKAIPLNGEKIRGFRAQVLILDEFLLLSEDMVKNVLMPFLVSPQNVGDRLKTKEVEDMLIEQGLMPEEDRTVFESTSKMIALSSASYTFENLYSTYKEWCENIYDDKQRDATYFVSQISYLAIPPEMVEKTVIEEASAGGLENPSFLREYCAQFTDGSKGYYSAVKMKECTLPDGIDPHLTLVGKKDKRYILAIDPSFSQSPDSDDFAMAVFELDEERRQGVLVHNYAVHGGNPKDHVDYFFYLINNFNIVFIMCDNADGNFIANANETVLFKDAGIEFGFIEEWDDSLEDAQQRAEMLQTVKNRYNLLNKRICVKFVFTSDSIRKGNEHLQYCIDSKRVWFGSRIRPTDAVFDKVSSQKVPFHLTPYKTLPEGKAMTEMIDEQENLIGQVKKQCSLIEVKSSPQGNQTFELPQHLKRSRAENRARKDSYTAFMLGNWAIKSYFEIMTYETTKAIETFVPIFVQ